MWPLTRDALQFAMMPSSSPSARPRASASWRLSSSFMDDMMLVISWMSSSLGASSFWVMGIAESYLRGWRIEHLQRAVLLRPLPGDALALLRQVPRQRSGTPTARYTTFQLRHPLLRHVSLETGARAAGMLRMLRADLSHGFRLLILHRATLHRALVFRLGTSSPGSCQTSPMALFYFYF